MTKAKAVLISDVHFNLSTLELASSALSKALQLAEIHKIPLIVAGDLNDTKAIIRGECINELIKILQEKTVEVIVLIGNHDLINEKSKQHTLNFLNPYVTLIDEPQKHLDLYFIPYQSSQDDLKNILKTIPKGSTIIMHQGVQGAHMGEYVIDKSSIEPEYLRDFRCISGHYHRTQNIGTLTYIGTPYSITFAEANDGPKGIQILMEDGSLEKIPLNLRKHVIVERTCETILDPIDNLNSNDLLWIKVSGNKFDLDRLNKRKIGLAHLGHENFKLDKIPNPEELISENDISGLSNPEMLDYIIDNSEESKDKKQYLKDLWRDILK